MYNITKNGKTDNEKSWMRMKIVLLFFCGILIFLIAVILMLMFSSIRLNIKKCSISNIEENAKKQKLEKDIIIYIEIYLLGVLKIAKIKVTKDLLRKLKIKEDIESLEKDVKVIRKVHPIKIIKKLKPKIKGVYLNLNIGLDNVVLTSYLVALLSTSVGIFLSKVEPKNAYFRIMPLYNIGNSIKFNLNCIIDVKIVHIIYVIYILLRKRRNNHERTSNRRPYDYSYE